jgi:starvation-inducible outer membrane lipoprotein
MSAAIYVRVTAFTIALALAGCSSAPPATGIPASG